MSEFPRDKEVSLLAGSKQEQRKEQLVLLQRSNVLLVLLTTHGANVLLTRLFKCTHAISFPVLKHKFQASAGMSLQLIVLTACLSQYF